MRISLYTKVFVLMLILGMAVYYFNRYHDEPKVTSVYIPVWKDFQDIQFAKKRVDIAILAFAKIDGTSLYFDKDPVRNAEIKANIKKLKANNKSTSFVLGIGGYKADGFSDASLDQNRYRFTDQIIETVKELDVDGVDIDWEYPASDAWSTISSRKEDTTNFTALMKELKEKLDALPHKNRKYYLTFASGNEQWYFDKVEVKKASKYADYINIMSYDLTGKWSDATGFNSNLYKDKDGKSRTSVDHIVQMFLKEGIKPSKLLMGVPAYSYGWEQVKGGQDGLFAPGRPIDIDKVDLSYRTVKEKYLNHGGFKRYFDESSRAAYLFDGNMFITYEDTEALQAKIDYIKKNNLAGAMVWEYEQDAEDGIVKYLSEHLNK